MALEGFVFTVTLPASADLLPLFRELSGLMSRYLGLPADEARQAGDVLEHVLADRLRRLPPDAGPVRVTFERPHTADTVTVHVRSAALSSDLPLEDAPGVGPGRDNGHSHIRLSWRVHDDG